MPSDPTAGGGGPISGFFRADHRRLDELLARATSVPGEVDGDTYTRFRAGLLRHIALEEKILLPASRRRRGGQPLELAGRLRADHGVLARLLVRPPTPALIAEIRSVLEPHNRLEEAPDGLYAACDALLADDVDELLAAARSYPEVRTASYRTG